MVDKNIGETIPLYDEVKKNIYKLYQELKNSSTLVLTASKYDYNTIYKIFVENYLNFYQEVCHDDKLRKLPKHQKIYLTDAYNYLINNNKLSRVQISKVSLYCRTLVELLGITKIEFRNNKDNFGL